MFLRLHLIHIYQQNYINNLFVFLLVFLTNSNHLVDDQLQSWRERQIGLRKSKLFGEGGAVLGARAPFSERAAF